MGPNSAEPSGAELRRYFALVWKRKWILLPIIVLIPLATYLISKQLPKTYEASTTIQVRDTGQISTVFSNTASFGSGSASTAARLITTSAVGRQAAKVLDQPPNTDLGASVSATVDDSEAGFVTITATGSDPQRVAQVANAYAAAIGAKRVDDATAQIDKTIQTLTQESSTSSATTRDQLAQQLQQLRGLKASLADATTVIQPASAPSTPTSPNPRRNATIALVLALLLAAGLVPLLESLDRRMRSPDDLEEIAPVLSSIPEEAFPDALDGPPVSEAFQTLRAALTYFNVDRNLSKVLVASASRAEGKTTVAVGLARALAADGRNVILIDADLRRPRVAQRLGITDKVHFGLEEVLAGRKSLEEAIVRVELDGGQLLVLPTASPPPNPSVITGSERMRLLLAEIAEQVDILVIDSPPLLAVSDTIPLLEQVSGTLLVARMDQTSRDSLRRANRLVSSAGGRVLGTVATGVKLGGIYGYGYGYGYGEEAEVAANGAGNGSRRFPRLGRIRTGRSSD